MVSLMRRGVAEFAKTYVIISAVLVVFAVIVAAIAHRDYLDTAMLVFVWGGFIYVLTSVLAWTGFANMYRYSPTLFIGSRSYRQRVLRGELWKEGRDDEALVIGVAFGAALMAVGAAIWNPLFLLVDALAVAVVAIALHLLGGRAAAQA